MNKRSLKLLGLTSLLFSLCLIPILANQNEPSEVSAKLSSVSQSTKDQVAVLQAPATTKYTGSYYNGITATKGKELRNQVHNLIMNLDTVGYDGLWSLYKTSDKRPDGTLWDTYGDFPFEFTKDQAGNYSNEGDKFNREHSIPKSWFGEAEPMKSDAFHVVPTDGKVNGMRSNYPLGEVGTASYTYTFGQKGAHYVDGVSKLGTSISQGISGKVFEPADCYKGDYARNYFYFVTCYYNKNISKAEGSSVFSSSNNDTAKLYGLTQGARDLFMKWHKQDPVSEKEALRCEAVFQGQGNRNPFIDHPEMVDAIWGDGEYNPGGGGGTTVVAPTLDLYQGPDIGTTGSDTKITTSSITLEVNETKNIFVYVDKIKNTSASLGIEIANSDSTAVKLSTYYRNHARITGLKAGTSTLTFKKSYDDNGTTKYVTKTLTVNVTGGVETTKTLVSLSKSGTLSKTTYTVGETFNSTGLTIMANFSSGSPEDVTSLVQWSYGQFTSAGEISVVGTYTYEGVSKTVTVNVTVEQPVVPVKTLVSLSISGQYKTEYEINEQFNPDGLTIIATYSDGSTEDVTSRIDWEYYTSIAGPSEAQGTFTYGDQYKIVVVDILVKEAPPIIEGGGDDDDEDDPPVIDDGGNDSQDETEQDSGPLDKIPGADLLKQFGCFGSIASTSFIVLVLSLVGCGLCLIKKRKEN